MAETIVRETDRLPWLTDERVPRKPSGRLWTLPLIIVGFVAIAVLSFWFGMTRGWSPANQAGESPPEVSIPIPAPESAPTLAREPESPPMPQVQPAPPPAPVVIRMQEDVRPAIAPTPSAGKVAKDTSGIGIAPSESPKEAVSERKPLEFTNPWNSSAASGRMVRIGTYSSLREGKRAWSRLARAFPAIEKLPAVVTDVPSLRDGRVYYRLQIGTTSQAHSEVLCQRMRAIGQSCVVVDLAGARKGSGDERQPADL